MVSFRAFEQKAMTPLIQHTTITLPLPTDDDRRAHDQRLRDALGLAQLSISLPVLRMLPDHVRSNSMLSCVIGRIDQGFRLIDVGAEHSYSLALDIGTTNLVALLYDNIRSVDVFSRSVENPQTEFGSDILTRLHHAMGPNSGEVYEVLLNGINDLITLVCRDARINTRDIHAMTVAGNTVMTHFFLGLDVSTIPVAPFLPVVRTPGFFIASELKLDINPEGAVYVFPNAGSYVGGDIFAGILASGMSESEDLAMLIDVGTNAEVVIGNKDWLMVGAGAAGPALEEGISRIGKRATRGIVYDVDISGGRISCKTFDQSRPEGICGSGMVSLLYEMHRTGMIDQTGVLKDSELVSIANSERVFTIACDGSDALQISQTEIQNFMRSKAAMFTLLLTLTRAVGISFRDIQKIFVSGALGTGINAEKAAGIGMLPAWPAERIKPLGNSSLAGARMLLMNGELAGQINALADRVTYKQMYDDPEFMKEFQGAVFIPHTNPELLKI